MTRYFSLRCPVERRRVKEQGPQNRCQCKGEDEDYKCKGCTSQVGHGDEPFGKPMTKDQHRQAV